jgi:hypothetical protein
LIPLRYTLRAACGSLSHFVRLSRPAGCLRQSPERLPSPPGCPSGPNIRLFLGTNELAGGVCRSRVGVFAKAPPVTTSVPLLARREWRRARNSHRNRDRWDQEGPACQGLGRCWRGRFFGTAGAGFDTAGTAMPPSFRAFVGRVSGCLRGCAGHDKRAPPREAAMAGVLGLCG